MFEQILELLQQNSIHFELLEHVAVRTSAEAAKVRGVSLQLGAKSMVLKAKGSFFLFVLPADKQIDWKKVKKFLGTKEVRFATEEEAENLTRVKMGSVPPFGLLFATPMFVDPLLLENEIIHFNPGSVTHTITMKSTDLKQVTNPTILSFTK